MEVEGVTPEIMSLTPRMHFLGQLCEGFDQQKEVVASATCCQQVYQGFSDS